MKQSRRARPSISYLFNSEIENNPRLRVQSLGNPVSSFLETLERDPNILGGSKVQTFLPKGNDDCT